MRLLSDPRAQLRFHTACCWLWCFTMVAVPFLPTFRGSANLAALLIMEVSLWANLATHLGAVSGAIAAIEGMQPNGLR